MRTRNDSRHIENAPRPPLRERRHDMPERTVYQSSHRFRREQPPSFGSRLGCWSWTDEMRLKFGRPSNQGQVRMALKLKVNEESMDAEIRLAL
jgi:hypothetical protein